MYPALPKFRCLLSLALLTSLVAGCGGSDTGLAGQADARPDLPKDLTELSVEQMLAGYRSKTFTAEEVARAHLAKIAQYEGNYNAFTAMNDKALEAAREVDRKRSAGIALGALAGVPVVIKESMDVAGLPSTAGWSLLSKDAGGISLVPARNAEVVQRMVDAGAILLGKTNIPAFSDDGTRANSSWAGPTYNAIDRTLAPGASSSGTATAVAAGFATVGLAEETGGSIQNPSSAQSLVGIKPTFALVPTNGVVPLAGSTRDVVGPIARTVRDAALVLNVIAGYSQNDPKTVAANGKIPQGGYASQLSTSALRGKRVGLYDAGWQRLPLSDETKALYEQVAKDLEARGAIVVRNAFAGSGLAELALEEPYDYRGTESAAYDLNGYLKGLGVSSLADLKARVGVSPFDPGAPLNWYVEALPALKASLANPAMQPDLSSFNSLRAAYLRIFNNVMDQKQLDVMVVPHATEALPDLASTTAISETSIGPLDIGGLPGVTVPAGQYSRNKAPFGIIFIGRQWSEASLLAYAYDYEQATQRRIKAALVR